MKGIGPVQVLRNAICGGGYTDQHIKLLVLRRSTLQRHLNGPIPNRGRVTVLIISRNDLCKDREIRSDVGSKERL